MQNEHHDRFLKSLNSILNSVREKRLVNSVAIKVPKYAYFPIAPVRMSTGN